MATGSRTPWVRQQFFDDNGNPLSGGLIDTYIAGSTTPINTYTDITLTTIHTNPIVLNTRGETTIFLDPTVAYKFVLRNPLPDGSEIWTQDNITALGGNSLLTDLGVIRSKVVGSATLPVPLATNVVVPYDTADYQVNLTGFDGAANKWVCPLDGVYDLNAAVDFTIQSSLAAPSASCEIFFLVNGVTSKNPKKWAFTTDSSGGQKTLETSGTLQLTKNDEVQVVFISATQGSGTSIDLILTDAFWDIISLSGVKGNTGDQGPAGPAGQGVPVGGTANQVLAKIDATDYNTQWVNDTSSPSQGVSGIINVANGSGGWIAMDGNPPLNVTFFYDNSIGVLNFTGASLFTTTNLESTNDIYISNDLGALYFRDNYKNHMAGISIDKDTQGVGLHDLTISGQNRLNVSSAIYINTIDPGTDTNKVMLVQDANTNKVEQRPLPTSGGSPSVGAAGIINIADGSGGWLAMDGSARPLLEWSSTTGNLSFTGGNFLISETIQAKDKLEVINDSGELRFRDTADTTTLANFTISKDALGSGLHQLTLTGVKELTLGSVELKVDGVDTFLTKLMSATSDPGNDTNLFNVAVDSTNGKIVRRPLTLVDNTKLAILNNLSDLNSVPTARTNLGLGTAALLDVGTSATNIVQLDALAKLPAVDGSQLTNISATDNTKLAILNNLSDLNSAPTARTNLGLGTAAVLDTGTGANNIVQLDGTSKLPAVDGSQLTNLPSGGSPSQGAQYDFNVADGSGGWTALDGTSFPRLYLDNATNIINYQSAIEASKFIANLSYDLHYDSGSLKYNDTSGTTLLAEIKIIKDSLGSGLHELKVFTAKRFTVNQDFRVNGQTSLASLLDSGTDTGKKMLVIDTTSKQVEERPIPSGGGTPSALPIMVLKSNAADAGFGPTIGSLIVPWNLETYKDTGFSHSNTTNTTRAIVDNDGTYLIQGRLRIFNSVNQRAQPIVNILKNGVLLQGALDSSYIRNASGASDYWTLNFTYEPTKLLANDYIEVELDLDIGSTASYNSSLLKAAESSLSIINLQGTKGDTGAQGPGGTDTNAVHVNVANEIAQITAKAVPSVDDVLIIEDSADSNNKKKVSVGALRNGVESFTNPSSLAPDASLITQINANAQAQTLTISVPTNPFDGAKVIYRIRAASTSTLTWNAAFNDLKGSLPTSAPINKSIYVGVIYDAFTTNWDVVSVVEQS